MIRLKQTLVLVFVLCCIACKKDKHDDADASKGNINEISIVISDVLWNGEVGDSLRKRLAAPVDGLTQEEPLFTLNQLHDKSFDGSLKKGRNIIMIDKDNDAKKGFSFVRNNYCAPQNVFTIKGKSIDEILELIDMHSDEIIRTIRQTEIAENQQRNIKNGLLDQKIILNQYNIDIKVPSTYRYAVKNKDFIWLKKEITSGNTNILLYKVPFEVIERNKTIATDIIKMRDSVGSRYIHGKEAGTYMVTEEAYSPYFFMTSFNDKSAFETRGNWEMKNDFMNGPFLNYVIRDNKHNCYLVIEGFIYSPSSPKRDLIVELESIIKSVKFT
ncbi:DUF4837 family protein [Flavobacterium sp. AG291]|uniref:DUF4837 family protein n=1 Tax=Flavobacterium sp. AG291 TaxID=2184000 RepID=UPI000E2B0180|nr:DUF4837 family protein [Flavobacterium sp. AG291]RDI08013.1 uncharacterized protein DUF4837 [Flavobacterium sp. AG291]